jgi:amino acid adenylation domain-containing protein
MYGRNDLSKLAIIANQKVKERNYWLKKLEGELEKSNFPYEFQKKWHEQRMETVPFQFPGPLASELIRLGKGDDRALHMILVAGLVVLLYKYTGKKDTIVGTPIYKWDINVEFINTAVALRNYLTEGLSFKEFLLQVRETMVEALENYSFPIEILVEKLNMPYSDNEFPLFDIAILLRNIHDKSYINHLPINMCFVFSRSRQMIEGELEYNSLLYNKAAIDRIIHHLVNLLENIFKDLNASLSSLSILSEEETRRVLLDFNDTIDSVPEYHSIPGWFEAQVEKIPDNIAVIYKDQELTYRELNEESNRLAWLLKERGVKPGTIVGIMLGQSLERIIGILAILKAGGAYLPIDPEYPDQRVLSILEQSQVSFLLTSSQALKKYSFTALQGLKFFKGIDPYITALRPPTDFDSLLPPDRGFIDFQKYSQYIGHAMVRHSLSMQASRGCPYNCAYCHRTMAKKNVARSAENIFDEVLFYYRKGIRRFSFVDEVFNLHIENSMRFFRLVLKNRLKVQLFFPNGMRADRLTKEYIDLMVEAGTVNVGLALETASPRLQKLIRKNLDIKKLRENAEYFCSCYPHVILELFTMHGFPTETQEEAMETFNFIKSLKWVHFPYVFLLKIRPGTDMMQLALDSGISRDAIERSMTAAFHEIPETLPFPKSFTRQYVAQFMNEYFLSKERLLHVLPFQMRIASERELVSKYDNYLPAKIKTFSDITESAGIQWNELGDATFMRDNSAFDPDYALMRKSRYQFRPPQPQALRVLLLDLSVRFSTEEQTILHGEVTEPLGLMYLLTHLKGKFDQRVSGKLAKAKIDFASYEELKTLVCDFDPHLIGIRTLSYFKDFFHETVSFIREWGIEAPIIAGGPYASSDYKLVLQDANVALAVLREGELTLAELVERMMENDNKLPAEHVLETIKGIAFIKNEEKINLKRINRSVVYLDRMTEKLDSYPHQNLDVSSRPNDLLYLISTSGSTGKPKSVMLEHRNLLNLLHYEFKHLDINFACKVSQFASIGFDVSFQEIFTTLLAGGELHLIDEALKNDIPGFFRFIREKGIEVIFLPTAFLKFIFSEPEFALGFPGSVRHIIVAGEQLVISDHLKQYLKNNRVYLHNHYGPTETHVVTAYTIDPDGEIPNVPPIGKPISNTEIYILDENRNPQPIGVVGELYISGENVGRGYHKKKKLTERSFMFNPFVEGKRMYKTGDLARWLPDGNVEWLGRVDHQVKIRGFRVELGEIENQLLNHSAIKEAVVITHQREDGDCFICAYFVAATLNSGDEKEIEVSELRDYLAVDLPDYMIPTYFIKVANIPLTRNGKVYRRGLPNPEVSVSKENFIAPRNEIERRLADIWSDILEVERSDISISSNFLEMGGHSLKATILVSRIHKVFNIKIHLVEIFQRPTIAEFAEFLKEAPKIQFKSIAAVKKKEYYPVSSAQKRLFILQQMEPDSISYNLSSAVLMEGEADIQKLEGIFHTLLKRHESFRTSFELIDDEPVQKIHEDVYFFLDYREAREQEVPEILGNFIKPFDLGKAPLLRAGMIKIEYQHYILMLDMHHIIADGFSTAIFLKEFIACYIGKELPPLRVQYKDFSEWQNSKEEKEKLERQEAFWLKRFKDYVPALNIPADYPGASLLISEEGRVDFEIENEAATRLRKLVSETESTLYIFLLAAYNVLLSRYTKQEDIVVGTPVAGRRHFDVQDIIGMFVNMLPMRNYPEPRKPFREFLEAVKRNSLEAFENQDYPFEELIHKLDLKRDFLRNPLVEIVFDLENHQVPPLESLKAENFNLKLKSYEVGKRIAKFDLELGASEAQNAITCYLKYRTELFKRETIEQMIRHFKNILKHVLDNPDVKIAEISMLDARERERIMEKVGERKKTDSGMAHQTLAEKTEAEFEL